MNLSSRPVTLKKGTIVATIKAANIIPPMLAAKPQSDNNNNNIKDEIPEKTHARLEKLFSKLDLSGMEGWDKEQKDKLKKFFQDYHHLFALEDLELGKIDLVKHIIKSEVPKPFHEWYQCIPPHQYEEVKKHLKQMVKIGVIRKSNSPWTSAVV